MVAVEELSALIGAIYDASLDRDLWSSVLQRTTAFIGGCSALLFSQDFTARSGRFYFNWGDDPEYTEKFFSTYMKLSPLTPHLMMTKTGDCYTASGLMPYDELVASRFFQEWCVPQGYTDLVAANLDKTATSLATVSVGRDVNQGLMDEEALYRMKLLAPHFRRAVLISRVLELNKLDAEMLTTTLDRIAAALFLVDGNATIVHANSKARAALEQGDATVSAGTKLTLFDAEANHTLWNVIAQAGAGDAAVATRGISISMRTRSGEPYVAHVMPLTSGERRASDLPPMAVAAVFIRKAALDLPLPIEAVTRQYHLTPSEMRVLYAVMEAGGVPAMAAMLGISEWTVKSHLAHLFEKTGAASQADLVKLVAGMASPLAG